MLTTGPLLRPISPHEPGDRATLRVPLIVAPFGYHTITLILRRDGTVSSTLGDVHTIRRENHLIYFEVGTRYPGQPPFTCAVRANDARLIALLLGDRPLPPAA